ncbi:hypothetical protein SPI_09381 [Niveomyces insectorum RCEF 264]|uniref:Uncharacterized protein n=1 Tax=Niveomyces insectorum RCEF 264 TaxID=1081102 RepID=A0A167LSN7_9HYPO|nr:hypothetical protein SPI_09381 [Niveomyces insectorum RCEF 264]
MVGLGAIRRSMLLVGNVTKHEVGKRNKNGRMWLGALDVAQQTLANSSPTVNGMKIKGAKAHQSHTVKAHSNVLSVTFFAGEQRIVSGHIHANGAIEYGRKARASGKASSNSGGGWQPTKHQVDQRTWTIYDPEKKKNREVVTEGQWWYIMKGADKVYF